MHRLDDYAAHRKLPPPDIVKMDVQGYELEILKGAEQTLRQAKLIMAECWLTRSYGPGTPLLHEIIAYLSDRGFVLIDLGDVFYDDHRQIGAVDAYFLEAGLADRLFPNAGGAPNWRR